MTSPSEPRLLAYPAIVVYIVIVLIAAPLFDMVFALNLGGLLGFELVFGGFIAYYMLALWVASGWARKIVREGLKANHAYVVWPVKFGAAKRPG